MKKRFNITAAILMVGFVFTQTGTTVANEPVAANTHEAYTSVKNPTEKMSNFTTSLNEMLCETLPLKNARGLDRYFQDIKESQANIEANFDATDRMLQQDFTDLWNKIDTIQDEKLISKLSAAKIRDEIAQFCEKLKKHRVITKDVTAGGVINNMEASLNALHKNILNPKNFTGETSGYYLYTLKKNPGKVFAGITGIVTTILLAYFKPWKRGQAPSPAPNPNNNQPRKTVVELFLENNNPQTAYGKTPRHELRCQQLVDRLGFTCNHTDKNRCKKMYSLALEQLTKNNLIPEKRRELQKVFNDVDAKFQTRLSLLALARGGALDRIPDDPEAELKALNEIAANGEREAQSRTNAKKSVAAIQASIKMKKRFLELDFNETLTLQRKKEALACELRKIPEFRALAPKDCAEIAKLQLAEKENLENFCNPYKNLCETVGLSCQHDSRDTCRKHLIAALNSLKKPHSSKLKNVLKEALSKNDNAEKYSAILNALHSHGSEKAKQYAAKRLEDGYVKTATDEQDAITLAQVRVKEPKELREQLCFDEGTLAMAINERYASE